MYVILSFFCCFAFQLGGLFCATYVFLLQIVTKVKKSSINNKYSRNGLIWICIFIIWALVSLISFSLDFKYFDKRNLVQFGYNCIYIILAIDIKYDYRKFNKAYVCLTLLFSIYMIVMYLWKSAFSGLLQVFSDREWGEGYIVGFSNSTGLPILYGMYLFLKDGRKNKVVKILFSIVTLIAVILTTSRANMLGAFVILAYYFAIKGKRITFNRLLVLVLFSFCVVGFIIVWSNRDPTFAHRLLVSWDREEIFRATMDYVRKRPLLGYGGNTFDVIYKMIGSNVASKNWLHTHNTILELLLRYGIIGLTLFVFFLYNVFKKIGTREARFMFLLFWLLSLTQIFFRNDIFIILLFFIVQETRQTNTYNNEIINILY